MVTDGLSQELNAQNFHGIDKQYDFLFSVFCLHDRGIDYEQLNGLLRQVSL
jgi:hypothetical protein